MTSDKLVIRTPEGVEFALPLAGIFSRMIAFATDLAVIAMIQGVLDQILAPLQVFGQDISQGVKVVLFFVIYLVYGALAEWLWNGQTVGKRLMGLRVMDSRGMRLEPSQVMVRNLMRFIDGLPLLYLVGGIACVLSRHQQRLGDLAAGTVVVRIPKVASPDLSQLLGGKFNSLAEHRHLAARLRQRVAPAVAGVALESLLRRDQLRPEARLGVFADLAAYFRSLVSYPAAETEQLSDEQYVRDVVEVVFQVR